MKPVLTALLLTVPLACQQAGGSNTLPKAETVSAPKPRFQYKIIYVDDSKGAKSNPDKYLLDFEAEVNRAITKGWQPIGGVAIAGLGGYPVQAMIKPE